MIPPSSLRRLVVAASILVVGALPGCTQSTEIPLAKVPPPPPDFGKPIVKPNTPKGGSPENASSLR